MMHVLFVVLFPTVLGSAYGPRESPGKNNVFFPSSAALEAARHKKISHQRLTLPDFEIKYFSQNLDHFTFTKESYGVFNQKYLTHTRFWRPGFPLLVYTGNEGDIEWFATNTGFCSVLARKFHAMIVFIEHRFYGESKPFGDESYDSQEKLGYLNSQQALADYAVLIQSLKHNLSCSACPVIVLGGSYGGMLAAWFRLKYPHIALGALASSAPILYFDDITPQAAFYDILSRAFMEVSENCYKVIKNSWEEVEAMWEEKRGREKVSASFKACRILRNSSSASYWMMNAFVYTAMMNYPIKANFMQPLPAHPVAEMCRAIDSLPVDASNLTKAIAAASIYYNYTGTQRCFDIENYTDPHGLDGWNWQTCTEMVILLSSGKRSMFPSFTNGFEEYAESCKQDYGVTPRQHWITTEFGGHRIRSVLRNFGSNIIFSNGLLDPWSGGGVLKNVSRTIIALVSKEGAHHLDLREPTEDDPNWLVDQRAAEIRILGQWLRDFYKSLK